MNTQTSFCPTANEQGFVLILSLVLLILLTLLGAWAMQTSDFENKVASNAQEAEKLFYTAEGGNYLENATVGFGDRDWYNLKDTSREHTMYPKDTEVNFFDPRDPNRGAKAPDPADVETWPRSNLMVKSKGDLEAKKFKDFPEKYDYRYLVTFLREDSTPGAGYSAERSTVSGQSLSSYKFRVQSNLPANANVVETAASKIGGSQAY